jgi:hypothetical protein
VETVYYDWFEDKDYTGSNLAIYYYEDPLATLQDWIIKYWDAYPLDYIAIIAPHTYKEFATLTDAAQWLKQNT